MGGTSGIGAAIVDALYQRGLDVLVMSDDGETGQRHSDSGGHFEVLDLALSPGEVGAKVQDILRRYGPPTYLFMSAGLTRENPAVDTSVDEWMLLANVNLLGVVQLCNHVAKAWRLAPGTAWQRQMVILGSVNALRPLSSQAAYTVMKAGLHAYAKCLSNDVAAIEARVNIVVPGSIWTPMNEPLFADDATGLARQAIASSALVKRWGEAREVADVAVWLALDSPPFVAGEEIVVDGGYLAKR